MPAMLGRKLERPTTEEEYFPTRDRLFATKRIGRMRGQDGQVILLTSDELEPVTEAMAATAETWAEAKLMTPLRAYLEGSFRKGSDLGGNLCIVQDTSTIGPRQGQWARPDFIPVSVMRFRMLPGVQLDAHSFELKTEAGGSVQAEHEALALMRFTHFGHLVWHLPEGLKAEARVAEIAAHSEAHGIGLIRMRDPIEPNTGEILVDPKRSATLGATIDGFLEPRLSPENRRKLGQAVRGGAA